MILCSILCIIGMVLFYRYTNDYKGEVIRIHSSIDQDQDGIDDQTDILLNTKEYISHHPKYKSKYYSTGYPNDEYGTCVDVVGYALYHSGYDLMELVNEDILKNPQDYAIQLIDKNIDFRRVPNLLVYFKNTAIFCTMDLQEIEEWQGGDIVVFRNHIGILSDRRNRNGIPYVIHHANPFQVFYEEDILEKRNDLVGHFRVSE
ncbi:MAG: DUF1287 domain-containing protein [Solobacterium sp.]|nr:DUF1287 domain-containing protein [Solobacterium sp.]